VSLIDLPSLDKLFRPRSVAILGASTSPTKIGGRPVASLLQNKFDGPIYPVNPRNDTVQGLPSYSSVLDIKEPVDLAICSVPDAAVKTALSECAEKGVGAVIVFSSGFAEVGDEGAQAQAEIADMVRSAGMRMMGPNCMGMVNFGASIVGSFHPAFGQDLVPGRIGLVSQSGAFGGLSYMLARERRQSLSFMLTTGNEADVDIGDCTAFLAEDPNTDVILLYMEGCRHGPKFVEALERARANGKPVVAVKLGRTEAGAAAAASHTAALAGEDSVVDAIFKQFGVYRASSIEEFFDVARACVVGQLPRNDRVAMVTVSGGVGVLMADDAHGRGLDVAPMPEDAQAAMLEMVPFAGPRNPIDVTGQILNDMSLLSRTMSLVTDASVDYATVIGFQGSLGRNVEYLEESLQGWTDRATQNPDSQFVISGFCSPEYTEAVERSGVLVFEEPTHATRAVAALRGFKRAFDQVNSIPEIGAASDLPTGPLDEAAALELLGLAGIDVPDVRVVASADEAQAAADALGYPVVVKVLSPDILHKSDIGGVKVGLRDAAEVRAAFDAVTSAGRSQSGATVRGALIAPMIRGGVETILGVQHDPIFGPLVMFGLGGVFVEALKDVTFRVAPFGVEEAHRMIREINAFPILTGLRGQPPCDLDALAQALSNLSIFAKANDGRLESLDINPYVVTDKGGVALDAAFVTGES
jgi:acetate---CoA ligase (ADP-forming)